MMRRLMEENSEEVSTVKFEYPLILCCVILKYNILANEVK